jgi:monoterpene epsilon-lactone hydrolase
MNFKRTVLYKLLHNGKKEFEKILDPSSGFELNEKSDYLRAVAFRKGTEVFDRVVTFMSTFPSGVTQKSHMIDGVHTWVTIPPVSSDKSILYIHGGAWVIGLTNLSKRFAAHLAKAGHSNVWTPEYRLAPEHPFPAGLDDVYAVYKAMLREGRDPKKITIVGESAGGNLTLALLLKLKQENLPLPGAAIPLSPFTDFNMNAGSYVTRALSDPLMAFDRHKTIHYTYLRGESPNNPLVSPLFGDLRDLPPILIIVGGREILYDDSVNFAQKAREAGVDVTLDVQDTMFHVYPLFYDILDEAKEALGKIVLFMQMKTG